MGRLSSGLSRLVRSAIWSAQTLLDRLPGPAQAGAPEPAVISRDS